MTARDRQNSVPPADTPITGTGGKRPRLKGCLAAAAAVAAVSLVAIGALLWQGFREYPEYYYQRGMAAQENDERLECLQRAAWRGHAEAQWQLSFRCTHCGKVPLAEDGVPVSRHNCRESSYPDYGGGYRERKEEQYRIYAENMWYLQKAAEKGHLEAQYWLGVMHFGGNLGDDYSRLFKLDDRQSDAECEKWLRKAAERGHAGAQYRLGEFFINCIHPKQGAWKEAEKWYLMAADQGSAEAQWSLATCYHMGDGVERNPAEAVKWYRKLIDKSTEPDADVLVRLGNLHYDEGDYAEAAKWCLKLAEMGEADGVAYRLGCLHEHGLGGIERNLAEAAEWYRKATRNSDDYNKEAEKALERLGVPQQKEER